MRMFLPIFFLLFEQLTCQITKKSVATSMLHLAVGEGIYENVLFYIFLDFPF